MGLLTPVCFIIGIVILPVYYTKRNQSITESHEWGPSPTGYGYVNPQAMNVTTPVPSGCTVIQPYMDWAEKSGKGRSKYREYCYAVVEFKMLSSSNTTLSTRTAANFQIISSYYKYYYDKVVPCYTGIRRPDLVNYFPYVYPVLNLRTAGIISGYVLLILGILFGIIFCMLLPLHMYWNWKLMLATDQASNNANDWNNQNVAKI